MKTGPNVLARASQLWNWICAHPLIASISALAAACIVVRPWGDFPLNDDWQYALVAKRFAETGQLIIDVPVAPALVGQTLLALPIIREFGFSHTALRMLTIGLAAALLFAVDRVLRAAGANAKARTFALVTLALSPFFFYLATTFMTEVYGLAPAMLAAAIWLGDRRRGDSNSIENPVSASPSWRAAIAASLLCGIAFWVRQFSALVLPALLGATLLSLALSRDWRQLARIFPRLILSLALLILCAVLHTAWARATHNSRPEQALELSQILKFDAGLWTMQPGIFLVYMTAFSLPLLLLFPRRGRAMTAALAGAALISIAALASQVLQHGGITPFGVRSLRHSAFPYIGEVLINAGLGPVTLSDQFWSDLPSPTAWPARIWRGIELVLIGATVAWAPVASAFARAVRERPRAAEVALFGALFALASFVAAVLVEQPWIHDRYYFPSALGLAISLAALVDLSQASRLRWFGSAVAACALAAFTIGGVHDEFRWNEVRWQLVNDAIASGAHPLTIDGGYEVDGWLHRSVPPGTSPQGCIGSCHCPYGAWECQDDSNRIGLSVAPGYEAIKSMQKRAWLGAGPILIWSRRK